METKDNGQQQQLTFYPAFCFKSSPTHFTWVKMSAMDVHRLKKHSDFGENFKHTGLFFYLNHPIRFVSLVGLIVAQTSVPRRTILTIDDSSGATIDVVILQSENPTLSSSPSSSSPAPDNTTLVHKGERENDNGLVLQQQPANRTITSTSSLSVSKSKPTAGTLTESHCHVAATARSPLDISPLTPGTMVQIKGTLSNFRSTMQVQLERFFLVRETNTEMRFLEQRGRFLAEVLSIPWCLDTEEIEALRVQGDEKGRRIEEEQERARRRQRKRAEREERDRRKILKRWEAEEVLRAKEAEKCREDGVRLMEEIKRRRKR